MRAGRDIHEIAGRLCCHPGLIFRAAERAGLPVRPGTNYRLADIAEGLARLVEDADKRARRDALTRAAESFRGLCDAVRKRISRTTPAGSVGATSTTKTPAPAGRRQP